MAIQNLLLGPLLLAAALLGGAAAPARTQSPILLKDINARPSGSANLGSEFRPLGVVPTTPPTLVFSAFTETHGRELWITQGTAASTTMVADWVPGLGSSDPGPITVLRDGTVLVPLEHPTQGRELHRLDLGRDQAVLSLFGEVNPGREGARFVDDFVPLSNGTYFLSLSPDVGQRFRVALHRTDGQSISTIGTFGPASSPEAELIDVGNDRLVFTFDRDQTATDNLFTFTPAGGVVKVQDLLGVRSPRELTLFNGTAYLSGDVPGKGREILKVAQLGQSPALALVADINQGPAGSDPQRLFTSSQSLYLSADDGTTGQEPWSILPSDQAARVADLNAGPAGSQPRDFFLFGGATYFTADDGQSGRELWRIVATTPTLAFDFVPGAGAGEPRDFVTVGSRLFASAATGNGADRQLWMSATGSGWVMVTSIRLGQGGAAPREPVALGNDLIFAGSDAVLDEPFRTVGSTLATGLLRDVNPTVPVTQNSLAGHYVHFLGQTYFSAGDGVAPGVQLFRTDGTGSGTAIAATPPAGARLTAIRDLRPLPSRGLIVMVANDAAGAGAEPWVHEPSTGRFSLLKDIHPGGNGSNPSALTGPIRVRGGRELIFFVASDAATGSTVWCTDGTPEGTVRLGGSQPSIIVPIDTGIGEVSFLAADAQNVRRLWVSDGTPQGTVPIPDPHNLSSHSFMVTHRLRAYFGALGPNGGGLWEYLGRTRGVQLIKDIAPANFSIPRDLTGFGDRLIFPVDTSQLGDELWISDGTASGTANLIDLNPGPQGSDPVSLTVAGDHLFFTARDGLNAPRQLYVVTPSYGVRKLANASGEPRQPGRMIPYGDRLLFLALEGQERTLWISDGTVQGTRRVEDIRRGPLSSQIQDLPGAFELAGGRLYVTADDGVHGLEPFIANLGASIESYGTPFGPDAPGLAVTTPALGSILTVAGSKVPANHLAVLLLGLPPRGFDVQLGGGLTLGLDPNLLLPIASFATGAGNDWQRQLPVPNDGDFRDQSVATRAFYAPTSGPPSLQATQAWQLNLGR